MDTKLQELVINEVTEEKLKELEDANAIPPNELFVTEDEDEALIIDKALDANSENPVTNAAVTQKFTEITPSITFAEIERQKSKNLFNINANLEWLQGCTLSRTEDTLTFNTTSVNGKFGYKISGLTVGKQYTVSVQDISYQNSLGLHIDFQAHSDTANFGRVTSENKSVTFTANVDYVFIKGYASYDKGNTMIVKKLQLEEGAVVTDYQPYNGEIIHEEQLVHRAMTKLGGVYLVDESYASVDVTNIEFKEGASYLIEFKGGVSSANDGKVLINNRESGYSILTEAAYDGASTVGVEENETHIPIRYDKYFNFKLYISMVSHYTGNTTFFITNNYSAPTSNANSGKYTRNSQGIVGQMPVNSIRFQSSSSFLRGTRVNIYKYGE